MGGGPCWLHGGKAKQVTAKREQRIAVWEAEQRNPMVIERREPEQVLLDLLHDADVTMAKLKSELSSGVSAPLLDAFGQWLDRTGKLAKIVIDSNLRDRLNDRLTTISRSQADQLIAVLDAVFGDPRVFVEPGVPVGAIVVDAMSKLEQQTVAAA